MTDAEPARGGHGWIVLAAALAVGGQGLAAWYLLRQQTPLATGSPAPLTPPPLGTPLSSPSPAALSSPPAPQSARAPGNASPTPAQAAPDLEPEARLALIESNLRRTRDQRVAPDQDLSLARRDLEQVLSELPEDPKVLRLLSEVLLASGEPDGALPYARRAVRADPEASWPRVLLAECLISLGQSDRAIEDLERVLDATAAAYDDAARLLRAQALTQRARTLIHQQLYDEAVQLLQQARDESPQPLPWVEFYTGYVFQRQRAHRRALPFYASALRIEPTLGDVYYYRAVIHYDLGNYREALADQRRARELRDEGLPHRYEAHTLHYVTGRTLEKLARYQEAYAAFQRFLSEAPGGGSDAASQYARDALVRLDAHLRSAPR